MIQRPKKIVISRTDSIGDVVLTLPIAGILKEKYPDTRIVFLGNTYTKPIIECSKYIDEIWEWAAIEKKEQIDQIKWLKEQEVDVFIHVFPRKELAQLVKKAGIKHRIGTSHRLYHLLTCNHRPSFTRKRSPLHEAQLNTKLLSPFQFDKDYSLDELISYIGFERLPELPEKFKALIDPNKTNLILHPKSQGSAKEWGVQNFMSLASGLDPTHYNVFFTGTEKEGLLFRNEIPEQDNLIDLTGKMTLSELIAFIAAADMLIAASTGPLHIAGITSRTAIGLFSTIKPIHPGRWRPLGNRVEILEDKKNLEMTKPLSIPLRDVLQVVENTAKK